MVAGTIGSRDSAGASHAIGWLPRGINLTMLLGETSDPFDAGSLSAGAASRPRSTMRLQLAPPEGSSAWRLESLWEAVQQGAELGVTATVLDGEHVSGISATARVVRESSESVGRRATSSAGADGLLLEHFVSPRPVQSALDDATTVLRQLDQPGSPSRLAPTGIAAL